MIGLFDSGVGGLTVAQKIFKALPDYKIIYFADTERVPYGIKSNEEIRRFSLQITDFLVKKGAKIIVVACNTSSSIALDTLKKRLNIPIFGVIEPGVKAALKVTKGKIGVIGTETTIKSNVHKEIINRLNPNIKVYAKGCPLLEILVEENWTKRPETEIIMQYYLKSLKENKIDTLILGCTHFPLIKEQISSIIGKEVELIDPSQKLAQDIKQFIKKNHEVECSLAKGKDHQFYVSSKPDRFKESAERILGRSIRVEKVRLG